MDNTDKPYLIPASSLIFEEEIKKSTFITHIAHTNSIEQAKAFVAKIKAEHSSARHNCWGFVAGRAENSLLWGFSDDGEPSGTAGKPILAQLSGSGIGEMTAVVTRYYGGIRLGTGGLVKAYGGGVQQALKLLQTTERKITQKLDLKLDYAFTPLVETLMAQYQGVQIDATYNNDVWLTIEIDRRDADDFMQNIINKSGARVSVSKIE